MVLVPGQGSAGQHSTALGVRLGGFEDRLCSDHGGGPGSVEMRGAWAGPLPSGSLQLGGAEVVPDAAAECGVARLPAARIPVWTVGWSRACAAQQPVCAAHASQASLCVCVDKLSCVSLLETGLDLVLQWVRSRTSGDPT